MNRVPRLFAVLMLAVCTTSHSSATLVSASALTAPPNSFVALIDGRAVLETGERLLEDWGPATAVAIAPDGAWTARGTSPCHAVLRHFSATAGASVAVVGAVGDIALSPDSKTLAYTRSGSLRDGQGSCGTDALVLRDVASGAERVWSATSASGLIDSLSWAPDGQHLVFESRICCAGGGAMYDLDVSTAPTAVSGIARLSVSPTSVARMTHPTYAGDRLLFLSSDGTNESVVDRAGRQIFALQDQGVSLAADRSGKHLLVVLYGGGMLPGSLLSIAVSQPSATILGRGYATAHW